VLPGWSATLTGVSDACDECGLDREQLSIPGAADMIVQFGPGYRAVLENAGLDSPRLRAHPDADMWSPLEYVVHVRDLIRYHGWLANRALKEDRPEVPVPDPGAIAATEAYNEADPREVLDGVAQQSLRFADRARGMNDAELDRVALRAGVEVSVRHMVVNVAHEGHHHLLDVKRLLA
jgi:DinB superfamily